MPARVRELDVLRGSLLLWMTLTHLPTRISAYSNQVAGYVSAAEGFIFLAAFFTGQMCLSTTTHEGRASIIPKLWQRTLRIYRYHLGLLAVAFTFGGVAAARLHSVPLANLLNFYLRHPKVALVAAPSLLYNPPLLDILPVYIVFMLLTPALCWAIEKWGWPATLAVSAFVWLLAQFHLRIRLHHIAVSLGFPIPLNQAGAFDLFAWQFLWSIGLVLGTLGPTARRSGARISGRLLMPCVAIAVILFVCRHAAFDKLVGPTLFDILVDKWRLGILRLVDFAAIGIILAKYGPRLAATRLGDGLVPLGRASLEVFSAHVLFCLLVLGFGKGPDPHFAWWQDAIVVTATLAGLFVIADLVVKRRMRYRRGAIPLSWAPELLAR